VRHWRSDPCHKCYLSVRSLWLPYQYRWLLGRAGRDWLGRLLACGKQVHLLDHEVLDKHKMVFDGCLKDIKVTLHVNDKVLGS
jgi:hypothetical protein